MSELNVFQVSIRLGDLKKRKNNRLTPRHVVETFADQIECMISEFGFSVIEVMEQISTASEPPYSPHTLRNAWFKLKRELREMEDAAGSDEK